MIDLVDLLTRLDEGTLEEDEEIQLFQFLVTTGMAWQLQGRIGRQAAAMLKAGVILPNRSGGVNVD